MSANPARVVGPNSITQMAHALTALDGKLLTARVFARAGLGRLYLDLPRHMVAQEDAASLHQAVAMELPQRLARQVARDAGARTARYLLAHRIPRPVQWLLKFLPPATSARLLLKAVSRNAWTFAGSGSFAWSSGRDSAEVAITDNPLAMAPCVWHEAVFETLFQALVSRTTTVRETACTGLGGGACRFAISWSTP